MRIKLEFERTAKVVEKGWVEVEVGNSASVADIYRKAISREFSQFLPADRTYEDEQWEYHIVKPKNT